MEVTKLVAAAFGLSAMLRRDIQSQWVSISFRVGGALPASLLVESIQRVGHLDALVRCLEDERFEPAAAPDMALHYQMILSELWLGSLYEILRLIQDRDLLEQTEAFTELAHHLKLLRIPIEKHEIAADRSLQQPLVFDRSPDQPDDATAYVYSKGDVKRAIILPKELCNRGSLRWHVVDVKAKKSYWLSRRELSDRTLAVLASLGEKNAPQASS